MKASDRQNAVILNTDYSAGAGDGAKTQRQNIAACAAVSGSRGEYRWLKQGRLAVMKMISNDRLANKSRGTG